MNIEANWNDIEMIILNDGVLGMKYTLITVVRVFQSDISLSSTYEMMI